MSLCETGYHLPSEKRLREALHWLILAVPGITVSMIILETLKNMLQSESPTLWFVYYCNKVRYRPLQSLLGMTSVTIVSPFMLTMQSLELFMHILIQILARKLDNPRGAVILLENQVVTRRMHRRLVISETGYFISAVIKFFSVALIIHIISTIDMFSNLNLDQLILFCGPSIAFFVIPMILTCFSSEVRSSICHCLKYFHQEMR